MKLQSLFTMLHIWNMKAKKVMPKGRERSAKWYFNNEKEVMLDLGLTPTKGSGSGWVDKEDGYNDFILAQLKSTDKQQYTFKKLDLEKLEYNAMVANKLPVFLLQWLSNNSLYAIVKITDIPAIAEYIKTGKTEVQALDLGIKEGIEAKPRSSGKTVKSAAKAREAFYKQKEEVWEGKRWKR